MLNVEELDISNALFQVVTYLSNKGFRSHVDELVISQVYRGKVACGESDTWDGVPLTVPPLPPTTKLENFCKLMEIEYHLDVSISAVLDDENQWHLIPVSLVTLPYKHFAYCIRLLPAPTSYIISTL
jgi:hypothetical protein